MSVGDSLGTGLDRSLRRCHGVEGKHRSGDVLLALVAASAFTAYIYVWPDRSVQIAPTCSGYTTTKIP